LEDGIIQLKQKAGDITFTATKQVRFDCETFEVHASNNIAFNAGTDITQTFGCMTVDAGSNASWAADGKVDFMSYQKVDGKAAAEVKAAGTKMTSVAASSGSVSVMSGAKIICGSKQDFGLLSKAMVSMTALAGVEV